MTHPVPPAVLVKVRKLARLPEEARQSRWAVSITRLTILKSLCREPSVANRFVTYLARKTLERIDQGQGRSQHLPREIALAHQQLMDETLAEMDAWLQKPTEKRRQRLWELWRRLVAEQNETRPIKWGRVRIIHDQDLLLFEYAVRCLLEPDAVGHWAYQTARHYAERYDSRYGTDLIPASAPLVQDIVDFWTQELGVDPQSLIAPGRARNAKDEKPSTDSRKGSAGRRKTKKRRQ